MSIRKRATIMFTDIVGYTGIMEEDELLGIQCAVRHEDVVETSVVNHGGHLQQMYGDGSLSVFDHPEQALQAAILIQEQMHQAPEVPIRIGVHLGEIVFDNGKVFGSAINITARIESSGHKGTILLSKAVLSELKDQSSFDITSIGFYRLKYVNTPMELFSLKHRFLPMDEAFKDGEKSKKIEQPPRLAVLPFHRFSDVYTDDFFTEGMTIELINQLSKIDGLQVISRRTAMRFQNTQLSSSEIGTALKVDYLLEGTLLKVENKVRISIELVDTKTEENIWGGSIERQIEEVLAIHSEIAVKVAAKIKVQLFPEEKIFFSKRKKVKPQAYQSYLKAMKFSSKKDIDNWMKATNLLEQSISADAEFASSQALLSIMYSNLAMDGSHISTKEAYSKSKAAIAKAIALNPNSLNTLLAQSQSKLFFDWDWEGAINDSLKAIEDFQGNSKAYRQLGTILTLIGKAEQAIPYLEKAQYLDPKSAEAYVDLARAYCFQGKCDHAIQYAQQALDLDPTFQPGLLVLGEAYYKKGRLVQAEDAIRSANKKGTDSWLLAALGHLGAIQKNQVNAKKIIEQLKDMEESGIDTSVQQAIVYAALSNPSAVFNKLDIAIERKSIGILKLHTPYLDSIRTDYRYEKILKQIGLDDLSHLNLKLNK